MGIDVHVFAGTQLKVGRDNGELSRYNGQNAVTRFTPRGDIEVAQWAELQSSPDKPTADQALEKIFKFYDFMNASVKWAKEARLNIVIVNHPLTQIHQYQTRELVLQLKALNIQVGVIHHDNFHAVESFLSCHYVCNLPKSAEGWEASAQRCSFELLKNFVLFKKVEAYYRIGSPLFFEPNFAISNSKWSERFIDPLEETKKIVVHPVLDNKYWTAQLDSPNKLKPVDILLVNPQDRKGPDLMAHLVRNAKKSWTFRVLKGGWGDAFQSFLPLIENSDAYQEGRVDFVDYVSDIRYAYDACRLVFFPSLYEGYGMAAVEPIYRGVPVVSSSYPAIVEATGVDVPSLCPFKDPPFKWIDLVDAVLENSGDWIDLGKKRIADLDNRHRAQMISLESFLLKMNKTSIGR